MAGGVRPPVPFLDTAGADRRGVTLDAYAGGRYSDLQLELNPQVARSVNQSADWIDPIVGGQVNFDLTEQFFIVLRGDIGGFGAGSDFAWVGDGPPRVPLAGRRARLGDPRRVQGARPRLLNRVGRAAIPVGHDDARSHHRVEHPLLID